MGANALGFVVVVASATLVDGAVTVVVEGVVAVLRCTITGRADAVSAGVCFGAFANAFSAAHVVARAAFVIGAIAVVVGVVSAHFRCAVVGGLNALALAVSFGCSTDALGFVVVVARAVFIHSAVAVVVLEIPTLVGRAGLNSSLARSPHSVVTLLSALDTRTYADTAASGLTRLALAVLVDGTIAVVVEVVVADVFDVVSRGRLADALVVDFAFVAFSLAAVGVLAWATFVDHSVAVFVSRFIAVAAFRDWTNCSNTRTPEPLCGTEFVAFFARTCSWCPLGKGVAAYAVSRVALLLWYKLWGVVSVVFGRLSSVDIIRRNALSWVFVLRRFLATLLVLGGCFLLTFGRLRRFIAVGRGFIG